MLKKGLLIIGIFIALLMSFGVYDKVNHINREIYSDFVEFIIPKINRPFNSSNYLAIKLEKPTIADANVEAQRNTESNRCFYSSPLCKIRV